MPESFLELNPFQPQVSSFHTMFHRLLIPFSHNCESIVGLGLPVGDKWDDSLGFVPAGYLKVQLQFENLSSLHVFLLLVLNSRCPQHSCLLLSTLHCAILRRGGQWVSGLWCTWIMFPLKIYYPRSLFFACCVTEWTKTSDSAFIVKPSWAWLSLVPNWGWATEG